MAVWMVSAWMDGCMDSCLVRWIDRLIAARMEGLIERYTAAGMAACFAVWIAVKMAK